MFADGRRPKPTRQLRSARSKNGQLLMDKYVFAMCTEAYGTFLNHLDRASPFAAAQKRLTQENYDLHLIKGGDT